MRLCLIRGALHGPHQRPLPIHPARPRSYTFDGSHDVALDVLRGACEIMALALFCAGTWGVWVQYRRGGYFQVRWIA